MGFTYTFKGVQFAIHGTYSVNFEKSRITLDGVPIAEINQKSNRLDYSILYESEVLNYKEHTVSFNLIEGDLYDVYKFVYWPSMRAKRFNSTDFNRTGEWKIELDGVGGCREYSTGSGSFQY